LIVSATSTPSEKDCQLLRQSITLKVLSEPDQRWQEADLKHAVNAAEYLQTSNKM